MIFLLGHAVIILLFGMCFWIMLSVFWFWLTDKKFRDADWRSAPGTSVPQNIFTITLFGVMWLVLLFFLGSIVWNSINGIISFFT